MSIKVIYNTYIEICEDYMYGKHFLDLPESIQNAIDEYFDGQEIEQYGSGNPDNMWVNSYVSYDNRELLTDAINMLSNEEFDELLQEERLDEYIEKHREEIEERISDSYVFLGYAAGEWHVFQ